MSFLLDTNVISEMRKRERMNPGVRSWIVEREPGNVYLSVLTLGELRRGIERVRRRDPSSADALDTWLVRIVEAYRDRLLAIDEAVAREWGRLGVPNPVPVVDGLLAATARVHGLTLVTRNLRDIERTGVDCLNPFSE